jgi:glycogen synthase
MTGLIPAAARQRDIRCLFTVHNIHTERMTLSKIEDRGVDAAEFWQHLFYQHPPQSYEQTRSGNAVDFLASGIFAADHVNTVSPTFLSEVIDGRHSFVPGHMRHELWAKANAGCATGILNAPDPVFDPATDPCLLQNYDDKTLLEGKRANKVALQERLGLTVNPDAPLFFWPSRLDPVQKGCQLVTDILFQIVADYAPEGLQVVVIANGPFQEHFHHIVEMHGLHERVAVRNFCEDLSHLGYAASDFIFMPSSFEPCGLPQMISPKFGSLTVAHDTGGLHDTVDHFDLESGTGNGFLFQVFDAAGLRWAVDEAMRFFRLPDEVKVPQLARIMREAAAQFNHEATAAAYIRRYEQMLGTRITGTRREA